MPSRSLFRLFLLLALLALAAAPAASAEPADEALRDRARTFLVLRLTEALDLADEEALAVSRVLRDSEDRRASLEAERREVEKKIRAALGAGETDEGRLGQLVDRAAKLDEEMALVPARSFRELRSLLTVEQQAKLALARPKIHEEIRAAMRRRLETRRAAPAPAP